MIKKFNFILKMKIGILKLYLIDLYHLGIEAQNRKTGRTDLKGIYKSRSKCKFNISEINKKIKS